MLRLPDLVGSPLSVNALREDLQISHKALSSWTQALERLYAVFRLAPFGAPRIRAVKKEQSTITATGPSWLMTPQGSRTSGIASPEVGQLRTGHEGP